MRAHSMNSEANAKVADVITGIFKHIEVNSDADTAYDTAGEYAVRIGWGYWRVITDYVREDSFDQEIYIRPIDKLEKCAILAKQTLEDAPKYMKSIFNIDFPCKLGVGVDAGINWQDKEVLTTV